MKTLIASVCMMLLLSATAGAQYVNIPDSSFRAYLTANYPACMSGNMLDTTCNDVTNMLYLNLSFSHCTSLEGIQYFDNLQSLAADGNPITYIPDFPAALKELSLRSIHNLVLPALPQSLTVLNLDVNDLTSLPALPNGLRELRTGNNHIGPYASFPDSLRVLDIPIGPLQPLPALPPYLTSLICYSSNLTSLPALPASLEILTVYDNDITQLPALPAGLKTLNISENPITVLDPLPPALEWLDVGGTQVTSLPALPGNLGMLQCVGNLFTQLPALPASLRHLNCSGTPLTSLPALPDSLEYLYCPMTQLSALPALPPQLIYLGCNQNPLLTSLPALPNKLTGLECSGCNLFSLPEFPNSLLTIYCHSNPNLTCLPYIDSLQAIYFSGTAIECVPAISAEYSDPQLSSFPLCNALYNPNGCNLYWSLSGEVFIDADADCNVDSPAIMLNVPVNLYDDNFNYLQGFTANQFGQYAFENIANGTYHIAPDTNLPFDIVCPGDGYYTAVLTPGDSTDTGLNFGLICKPGFDVGVTTVTRTDGIIRPANFAHITVKAGDVSGFYKAHCAAGVSGMVQVVISGPAAFISSDSLQPVIYLDTVTWNVPDFGAVDFNSDFNMLIHTDTLAQIGQQVCFEVTVTPTVGDNNISNNTLTHCFDVVNSYDPNDKTAYPSGDIDTAQEWINYTIRFQNTGNAPAQHVYVMDTLDSDVDASTFRLLAYSHDNITQVLPGGIIKFNFPNINLPDSFSNEPGSHGYIQYKIKLKDNLPLGTTISNTAFIYFDFNAPVVTNTAVNTITNNVGIGNVIKQDNLQITLLPNPAHNNVTVQLQNVTANSTLKVFDVLGSLVKQQSIQQSTTAIDISTLASGIYYVQVETAGGKGVKKLVVQ